MYSGNLNNTRCDDPRKLMKQTSFKVKKKKPGGNNSKRTIHYIKLRFIVQEYQFVVNLTIVTNLSSEPLRHL